MNIAVYSKTFNRDTSGLWSPNHEYNLIFLMAQQHFINDKLQVVDYIMLNEVFDMLGLERTRYGVIMGWIGGSTVDFDIHKAEDDEGYDLTFKVDGIVYDLLYSTEDVIMSDESIFTPAAAFNVEGARVGLVSCKICGAAILLDHRDPTDVIVLHMRFHKQTLSVTLTNSPAEPTGDNYV